MLNGMALLSLDTISKGTRLEILVLINVESSYLNDFQYLNTLPRLLSLIVISNNYFYDQDAIYHQIFHLSAFKYCKISLEEKLDLCRIHIFISNI
jgi:hypothetical protein